MEIDIEHPTKKPIIESPPGSDIVIQEEEIEEVERHESIVFVHFFPTVETSLERMEGRQINPSTNIMAQYNTMRLQAAKNI